MKKAIIFVVMLALCVTGCGAGVETGAEPVISTVSAEDCFLCGSGTGESCYWGQNNVGIISLNSFSVIPITINRYDGDGALIEKNAGHLKMRCPFGLTMELRYFAASLICLIASWAAA